MTNKTICGNGRLAIPLVLSVTIALAVMAGCSQQPSLEVLAPPSQDSATIRAVDAGGLTASGTLAVEDGECIVVRPQLDDNGGTLFLSIKNESSTMEIEQSFSRQPPQAYSVPAGEYSLEIRGANGANGYLDVATVPLNILKSVDPELAETVEQEGSR